MTTIVLFGGRSDERHVSVATAQNVARAFGSPLCWFWSPDGAVHDVAPPELLAHQRPFEMDYVPSRPALWPDLEQALDTLPVEEPVFFLALHGGEGEDGTVQRMMEQRRIAFTGSGADASELAFDKGRAKEVVRRHVRVAESRIAWEAQEIATITGEMLDRHDKVVLKPLAGGSSRGLFFAESGRECDSIVREASRARVPYLIEQFISGRELTVAVVDMEGEPVALPVLEIETDPGREFDYEGKYLGKGTREICPANISEKIRDDAQATAVRAHLALGCEGYSRTDVIASPQGVYFLELNTLPGLTSSSLVPQQLREAGIGFHDFLDRQLELAKRRAATGVLQK
ncbi:MAG TPA: ATP-grasp domain-containing protein [Thermoanaerobaculia bacterium]|nr:ATP-grasp domain-containing protein [Thermoanaerobaculia bacterium]